jgi:hypothetical protein
VLLIIERPLTVKQRTCILDPNLLWARDAAADMMQFGRLLWLQNKATAVEVVAPAQERAVAMMGNLNA